MYRHLPDDIYKSGRVWRVRIDCHDMTISEAVRISPLSYREIVRRIRDRWSGESDMSVREIFEIPGRGKIGEDSPRLF